MNNTARNAGLYSIFFVFAFVPIALGVISIAPDFTGTLMITSPDGTIVMIDAGEAIPEIPSGSTIQVFNGQFSIETQPGDSVEVLCLNHTATVSDGDAVFLRCGESSGLLEIKKGTVDLVDPAGKKWALEETKKHPISLGGLEEVPPGEEGEGPSFETESSDIPVDSRSIEASPLV